jgi:capsular polysaccharide export protein
LSLFPERVQFVRNAEAARRLLLTAQDTVVVWGAFVSDAVAALCHESGARLVRLEDGIIRSVGLGSDLIRPLSIVADARGMYFDPRQPSDLEVLLNTGSFSAQELEEAARVRSLIVAHGLTKYNLEPRETLHLPRGRRRVVLVPGQVEDDASIRLGARSIQTNLGLLQRVRADHPDAFVVYKPHPDAMSGNRVGLVSMSEIARYADHVETSASIVSCIEACDEMHALTSLSGFDALLRGKRVVTYGQPFYAGWGLTEDRDLADDVVVRRQRRLMLDELVAGALLRYPLYWDWDLRGYTTCRAVVHRLIAQRQALESSGNLARLRVGYLRRQLRKARILLQTWSGSSGQA